MSSKYKQMAEHIGYENRFKYGPPKIWRQFRMQKCCVYLKSCLMMLTSVSTFEKYFGQKATKKGVVQVRKLYRVAQSRKDELPHTAQSWFKIVHQTTI